MSVTIRQDIKRQNLKAAARDSVHMAAGCTASRRQTTLLGMTAHAAMGRQ